MCTEREGSRDISNIHFVATNDINVQVVWKYCQLRDNFRHKGQKAVDTRIRSVAL